MGLRAMLERGAKGLDWEADSVSWSSTTLNGNLPYAPRVSREYRPAWYNSALYPCLTFAYGTFTEAELCVERKNKATGRWDIVEDHPFIKFMRRPCGNDIPYHNLVFQWILGRFIDGNGYFVKRKNLLGRTVLLYPFPHYGLNPVWDDFQWPGVWVHHYSTVNRYGNQQDYRVDEVFHSRYGLNPENQRKGLSPLASIFRDIMSDEEIALATHAMARNPISALLLSPKDPEVDIDEAEGEDLAEQLYSKAGGDQRGRIITPSIAVDVTKIGYSPSEMLWDKLRALPASRICPCFNLDPLAVNLPSDNNKLTNLEQARQAGVESCTTPMWRDFAADCDMWLLPEFGDFDERVNFNKSGVRVLQSDEDNIMDRAVTGYRGGILTRARAKTLIHEPTVPEDDIHITDLPGGTSMADHSSTLENSRRGEPLPGEIVNNGKGKRNQMQKDLH